MLPITGAGVVDLTFVSVLPRVLEANVKSKTTQNPKFASVPLVLTFENEPASTPYECQNRDISFVAGQTVLPGDPISKD
jgi:hypothetical protein